MNVINRMKISEENSEEIEERNKLLVESVDDLEQYSRQNCLLLHGVKKTKDENTHEFTIQTLSKEINIAIILKALTKRKELMVNDGKLRSIIIKCTRSAVRKNFNKSKKKLKGKNYLITESLTIATVTALKVAQA